MENTTLTPEQIEEAKQILLAKQEEKKAKDAEFQAKIDALCLEYGKVLAVKTVDVQYVDKK